VLVVQRRHKRFRALHVAHEDGVVLLPALRPRRRVGA
jgi:hypothetical protein